MRWQLKIRQPSGTDKKRVLPLQYRDKLCALIVWKFPIHLLSKGSVFSASGCVSCCVWVTWPAWTAWSVCTASAARKRAAAYQSCMDYCEHLANFAVRTIRLAFWVNYLQLCLRSHIQQHKHSDRVNATGIPPLQQKKMCFFFLVV